MQGDSWGDTRCLASLGTCRATAGGGIARRVFRWYDTISHGSFPRNVATRKIRIQRQFISVPETQNPVLGLNTCGYPKECKAYRRLQAEIIDLLEDAWFRV